GAPTGVASISSQQAFQINLGRDDPKAHQRLLADLSQPAGPADEGDLLPFVQRRQLQTYDMVERLKDVLKNLAPQGQFPANSLGRKMELIGHLIDKGFGTRLFYLALDGFDTHSGQVETHRKLLEELATAVSSLFARLKQTGHDKRVLVMTFSEFGRRVQE